MVLAEAFMKRNDIKKQIAVLTTSAVQNLWQDKSLPINFDKGIKINPTKAYFKISDLMTELQALNVAIANANVSNNTILRELETTTARIALTESVLQYAQSYPGDKVRSHSYGEITSEITENEWLIDPQGMQKELKDLQDKKRDLEKSLAHNNFVTEVLI